MTKHGLSGMRLSPIYYPGKDDWLNARSSDALWKKAEELRAVFNFFIATTQLPKLEDMVRRFPQVRIVIDHLARMDLKAADPLPEFKKLLALAQYPNVWVKVSELSVLSPSGKYPYQDTFAWVQRMYDASVRTASCGVPGFPAATRRRGGPAFAATGTGPGPQGDSVLHRGRPRKDSRAQCRQAVGIRLAATRSRARAAFGAGYYSRSARASRLNGGNGSVTSCSNPAPLTRPRQVEAVKIHHLVPRSHEVTHKRLLRVVAGIDFRDGSELRVRTEDEVDGGAGPLDLTRPAVAPLVEVLALGRTSATPCSCRAGSRRSRWSATRVAR